MRTLLTIAALALGAPSWSSDLVPCNSNDAAAVMAKMSLYSMAAPESPKHNVLISTSDGGGSWIATEYSGLRMFARCKPVSKADQLNGVLLGEIELRYEASRFTRLPEVVSGEFQWDKWSAWSDFELPPENASGRSEFESAILGLARMSDRKERFIQFRKSEGKIQLSFEYKGGVRLLSFADFQQYKSKAKAKAAAEQAEQTREIEGSDAGLEQYVAMIQQHIERHWNRPPSSGFSCVVAVTQTPNGTVTNTMIENCNASPTVRQSIENAVSRSSPLPLPSDQSLFQHDLRLTFAP